LIYKLHMKSAELESLRGQNQHHVLETKACQQQMQHLYLEKEKLMYTLAQKESSILLLQEQVKSMASFEKKGTSRYEELAKRLHSAQLRQIEQLVSDSGLLKAELNSQQQTAKMVEMRLSHDIAALESETERLSDDLAKRTLLYQAQETRMRESERAHHSLAAVTGTENAMLQGQLNQVKEQLDKSETSRMNLHARCKELEQLTDNLRAELSVQTEARFDLSEELDAATKQIEQLQYTVDRLRGSDYDAVEASRFEELERERQKTHWAQSDLQRQLDTARKDSVDARQQKEHLLDELQSVKALLHDREHILRQIQLDPSGFGGISMLENSQVSASGVSHNHHSDSTILEEADSVQIDGTDPVELQCRRMVTVLTDAQAQWDNYLKSISSDIGSEIPAHHLAAFFATVDGHDNNGYATSGFRDLVTVLTRYLLSYTRHLPLSGPFQGTDTSLSNDFLLGEEVHSNGSGQAFQSERGFTIAAFGPGGDDDSCRASINSLEIKQLLQAQLPSSDMRSELVTRAVDDAELDSLIEENRQLRDYVYTLKKALISQGNKLKMVLLRVADLDTPSADPSVQMQVRTLHSECTKLTDKLRTQETTYQDQIQISVLKIAELDEQLILLREELNWKEETCIKNRELGRIEAAQQFESTISELASELSELKERQTISTLHIQDSNAKCEALELTLQFVGQARQCLLRIVALQLQELLSKLNENETCFLLTSGPATASMSESLDGGKADSGVNSMDTSACEKQIAECLEVLMPSPRVESGSEDVQPNFVGHRIQYLIAKTEAQTESILSLFRMCTAKLSSYHDGLETLHDRLWAFSDDMDRFQAENLSVADEMDSAVYPVNHVHDLGIGDEKIEEAVAPTSIRLSDNMPNTPLQSQPFFQPPSSQVAINRSPLTPASLRGVSDVVDQMQRQLAQMHRCVSQLTTKPGKYLFDDSSMISCAGADNSVQCDEKGEVALRQDISGALDADDGDGGGTVTLELLGEAASLRSPSHDPKEIEINELKLHIQDLKEEVSRLLSASIMHSALLASFEAEDQRELTAADRAGDYPVSNVDRNDDDRNDDDRNDDEVNDDDVEFADDDSLDEEHVPLRYENVALRSIKTVDKVEELESCDLAHTNNPPESDGVRQPSQIDVRYQTRISSLEDIINQQQATIMSLQQSLHEKEQIWQQYKVDQLKHDADVAAMVTDKEKSLRSLRQQFEQLQNEYNNLHEVVIPSKDESIRAFQRAFEEIEQRFMHLREQSQKAVSEVSNLF
jgi:hypothetical protein